MAEAATLNQAQMQILDMMSFVKTPEALKDLKQAISNYFAQRADAEKSNIKYANDMTSSLLIHPGEMIKEEIEARGITQKEVPEKMGVSYTVFNEILNGKRPVTTEYALLLEAVLGIDAGIWLRLQADYNMQEAKADKSFMSRLEHIRRCAAVL